MTMDIERRFLATRPIKIEKREGGKQVITGYAAVFFRASDAGTEYTIWSDLVERIMPGAFDQVLRGSGDIVALFNHDKNRVLGRRSAKTLRMSVDEVGLKYEIDAPDCQHARDLIASLERGDVKGSSFSFAIGSTGKVVWVEEGERTIREVHAVGEVYDVGPVTFPAYEATTAGARDSDAEAIKRERDKWRRAKSEQADQAVGDLMMVNTRCAAARRQLEDLDA
jgi:HK97 family phage prohead protease